MLRKRDGTARVSINTHDRLSSILDLVSLDHVWLTPIVKKWSDYWKSGLMMV